MNKTWNKSRNKPMYTKEFNTLKTVTFYGEKTYHSLIQTEISNEIKSYPDRYREILISLENVHNKNVRKTMLLL